MDLFSYIVGDVAATPEARAAQLVDQIANSRGCEERRAPLQELRELSGGENKQGVQGVIGKAGIPSLIVILQLDRQHADVIQVSLEILCDVMTSYEPEEDGEEPVGVQNTVTFLLDSREGKSSLDIVLGLLDLSSFHVRLNTLHLLQAVLKNKSKLMQDSCLRSVNCVNSLVAVLQDDHDIIRTEALWLLAELTKNNKEIQNLIATVGDGLEQALVTATKAAEEDLSSESMSVVGGCLTLVHNLLANNNSNQTLFIEMGFIGRAASLLSLFVRNQSSQAESLHANVSLLIDILRDVLNAGLRSKTGPGKTQSSMCQSGITTAVLELSLCATTRPDTQAKGLGLLGELVRRHPGNKAILRNTRANWHALVDAPTPESPTPPAPNGIDGPPPPQAPASMDANVNSGNRPTPPKSGSSDVGFDSVLLGLAAPRVESGLARVACIACVEKVEPLLRSAAEFVFSCYIEGDDPAKDALANALAQIPQTSHEPTPTDRAEKETTTYIVAGVIAWPSSKCDPFGVWFSGLLLAHVLEGSASRKQMALAAHVQSRTETRTADLLLPRLLRSLSARSVAGQRPMPRVTAGLLRLLAVWFFDFPPAIAMFEQSSANVPALRDIILSQSANVYTRGLAALVLAIGIHSAADASKAEQLLVIVTAQIGIEEFSRCLDCLRFDVAAVTWTKESQGSPRDSSMIWTSEELKRFDDFFDTELMPVLVQSYERVQAVLSKKLTEHKNTAPSQPQAARSEDSHAATVSAPSSSPPPDGLSSMEVDENQIQVIQSYKALIRQQDDDLRDVRAERDRLAAQGERLAEDLKELLPKEETERLLASESELRHRLQCLDEELKEARNARAQTMSELEDVQTQFERNNEVMSSLGYNYNNLTTAISEAVEIVNSTRGAETVDDDDYVAIFRRTIDELNTVRKEKEQSYLALEDAEKQLHALNKQLEGLRRHQSEGQPPHVGNGDLGEEFSKQLSEKEETIRSLQSELKEAAAHQEELATQHRKHVETLESQIASLESQLHDLGEKLVEEQKRTELEESKTSQIHQPEPASDETIDELRGELSMAQSELDDAFVMIYDMNERQERYKNLLIQLGHAPSSSDDDDDDDDDDDAY
eukprot:Rmarinus@m.16625